MISLRSACGSCARVASGIGASRSGRYTPACPHCRARRPVAPIGSILTTSVEERWNMRDVGATRMQVLRDVMAALPVPITIARLPFQFSPSSYWLECITLPAKSFRPAISRHARNAADAGPPAPHGADAWCAWCIGAAQRQRSSGLRSGRSCRPRTRSRSRSSGSWPRHRLRTSWRACPWGCKSASSAGRHVGQVVDLHLIVQRQRMVALAPIVADALFAIDNRVCDV